MASLSYFRTGSLLIVGVMCFADPAGAQSATVQYQYDALGRLIQASDPTRGNRAYGYDAAGNRQSVALSAPAAMSEPDIGDLGSDAEMTGAELDAEVPALGREVLTGTQEEVPYSRELAVPADGNPVPVNLPAAQD